MDQVPAQPMPPQTPPPNEQKKKLFNLIEVGGIEVIIIVVFLSVVIGALAYFKVISLPFLSNQSKTPTTTTTQSSSNSSNSITGLLLADNIAKNYLSSTIRPEGGYYTTSVCDKTQKLCNLTNLESATHSGQIIAAYYELYQKTNTPTYKKRADESMEYILTQCETNTAVCEWNFFPLYTYYKATQDDKYKNAMLKLSNKFLTNKPLAEYLNGNEGVKLWMLYDITGDIRYRDQLKQQVNAILDGGLNNDAVNPVVYTDNGFTLRKDTFKTVWADIIPAYLATKDPKYLQAAKDIMDRSNVMAHVKDIQTKGYDPSLIFALEGYLSIAQADPTEASKYNSLAHQLAQVLINDYADLPGRVLFNGDYGFLLTSTGNRKDSLNNGWVIRTFLRMGDQNFTLP